MSLGAREIEAPAGPVAFDLPECSQVTTPVLAEELDLISDDGKGIVISLPIEDDNKARRIAWGREPVGDLEGIFNFRVHWPCLSRHEKRVPSPSPLIS